MQSLCRVFVLYLSCQTMTSSLLVASLRRYFTNLQSIFRKYNNMRLDYFPDITSPLQNDSNPFGDCFSCKDMSPVFKSCLISIQSSKLSTNSSVLRVSWFLNLFSLHICRVQDRWTHIHSYQVCCGFYWHESYELRHQKEFTQDEHSAWPTVNDQKVSWEWNLSEGHSVKVFPNWAEKWWNQNGHRCHPPQDDLILFKKLTKRFFRRPGVWGLPRLCCRCHGVNLWYRWWE